MEGTKAENIIDWLGSLDERKTASRADANPTLETILQDDTGDLDKEGAKRYRLQQIRERSESNRRQVFAARGHVCEVCAFDFKKQFGADFSQSANVHHKNPLALGERKAASADEFAVLCAPCHTAAHMGPGRKLNPWTIEELRSFIRARWDR